jgi:hypothetical protein
MTDIGARHPGVFSGKAASFRLLHGHPHDAMTVTLTYGTYTTSAGLAPSRDYYCIAPRVSDQYLDFILVLYSNGKRGCLRAARSVCLRDLGANDKLGAPGRTPCAVQYDESCFDRLYRQDL